MKRSELSTSGSFLLMCFVIISYITGFYLIGNTTMYLWKWFVVPIFAVEQITIVQSIGLSIFVTWMTNHQSRDIVDSVNGVYKIPEEVKKYLAYVVTVYYIAPLIPLFFGWVFVSVT